MQRILVLGAGLVARPGVHYLADQPETQVVVASLYLGDARALIANRPNCKAVELDVRSQPELLDALVKECDIAVSLLPATEHPKVTKACLKHKKHMSTASYISPEIKALGEEARHAGITILNECGVDPGLDHMSAMRIIDAAHRSGGKVTSFRSYCGGLPAPEANTNPLGYKFSWAPRGVLVAASNPARYLERGVIQDIRGDRLFADPELVDIPCVGRFEGYPNRDSLPYIEMYGLEGVETMFRGTLRNEGHCETWFEWVNLGLFDTKPIENLAFATYKEALGTLVPGQKDIKGALAKRRGLPPGSPALEKLDWLGLLSDEPVGLDSGGMIDVMAKRMAQRCAYAPKERDMLVMQHQLEVTYPGRREQIISSLVDFGLEQDSSMARTVSLPLAIATKMILDKTISEKGVIAPVDESVYNPILDLCEDMGIRFTETVKKIETD